MEQQTQYLMWLRSKQIFKSHYQASMSSLKNSWEEQAFAEDIVAAGPLGSGLVWPPRSYSCTFCTREFRSAQALGGHMNVHRRDRARLKQSLQEHQTPSTLSLRVETNLSMGQIGVDNKETIKSKRQKNTDISSFASCSSTSSSSDRYVFGKPEMLRIKSHGLEDNIDLELRLGDPPAIK